MKASKKTRCRWMALVGAFLVPLLSMRAEPGLPPTVAAGATLEAVYTAPEDKFEGPTWDPGTQSLYFTAFGAERSDTRIMRLDAAGRVTVWLDRTEGANGTFLGHDGRLLCAQSFAHRVLSYGLAPGGPSDTRILLEDSTLNQPNDLCEAADGSIYFTDPDFPKHQKGAVYLLRRDGTKAKIIVDMPTPNGLGLSANGRTLVVSESEARNWRAYPVKADGTVGTGRIFFDPPMADRAEPNTRPDGLRLDERGNYYFTGRKGIWVVDPHGEPLGFIPVPLYPRNVCFGGPDGRDLFIACHRIIYRLRMRVKGAP